MIAGAPDPVAPFSHAVEADGWVFVTGQMPFSGIANDSSYPEGIEAQTHQVMANLKRVLAALEARWARFTGGSGAAGGFRYAHTQAVSLVQRTTRLR